MAQVIFNKCLNQSADDTENTKQNLRFSVDVWLTEKKKLFSDSVI